MNNHICSGKRIYLRQVKLSDASDVVQWKQDPVVKQMALDPDTVVTLANQKRDIKRAITSPGEIYAIVVVKETESPIGYIRINWMDEARKFAWLRFALGAERGKGYGKDAVGCLIDHLFKQGLHRAEAETYDFNEASAGLLESLGFVKEGIKRQAHFDGIEYRDVIAFGLLRQDFRNPA
jgi:RimJ/RimL family protein N-acetyltransferase